METGNERVIRAVTCLGCGCTCDDIEITVNRDRIVAATHACTLGVAWFGDGTAPALARVDGRDTSIDEALDTAAALLGRATRPLIYLAPDVSCEAQREAIAIADRLHAALDSATSATAMGSVLAAQERGRAGATLGEIRNRADLLVFWGVDPMLRYPRYWTRYAPDVVGVHVPDGRRSRTVVAVDIGESRGPADADLRIALSPEEELATLVALRALVSDTIHARDGYAGDQTSAMGRRGPWAHAHALVRTLVDARYVALVVDAEAGDASATGRADAIVALSQALNGPTRCALSILRAGGNRSGADAVATWQTGYPAAIGFGRGYPSYHPHDGTARARLGDGEVDALLIVGSPWLIPSGLVATIGHVSTILIGPRASEAPFAHHKVIVDTATAGIHEAGTAIRMDDVPIPVRALVSGPPAAVGLVRSLGTRLASRRRLQP